MVAKIPTPAKDRLVEIYRILKRLKVKGISTISSSGLGKIAGTGSHNIRKDISYIGEVGNSGSGYKVEVLAEHIAERFGLIKIRKACVVGLGRLGQAILGYRRQEIAGYNIIAGFDSDVNHLETIKTDIKVYPSYEIEEIVWRKKIQLAAVTVPSSSAQKSAERLIAGGIKGILNFSSAHIECDRDDIFIKNMDVLGEFWQLSAKINEQTD